MLLLQILLSTLRSSRPCPARARWSNHAAGRPAPLFRLSGNLDIYTVPRFVRQIEFFDPASDQLLVNLADVRLLDSAGICALVSLRNRTHRAARRFGLVGSSPRMRRLLGYAGLDSALTFGEDRTTVAALPGV